MTANAGKFSELPKVWFPNMVKSKENPEPNSLAYCESGLDRYIDETYKLPPRKTIRVSDAPEVVPNRTVSQILLPAEIVNATNNDLDLQSMCSDTMEGVFPKHSVNVDHWGLLGR